MSVLVVTDVGMDEWSESQAIDVQPSGVLLVGIWGFRTDATQPVWVIPQHAYAPGTWLRAHEGKAGESGEKPLVDNATAPFMG